MEIVKENNTAEEPKKEARLLIVIGVDEISKQFLKEAIVQILHMSGYSVNAQEFDKPEDTDFHVIVGGEFNIEQEAKAKLVFSSYRDPQEVINEEYENRNESADDNVINATKEMLNRYVDLAKWMRSSKLAYCMDYNAPMNEKGLHNYNNLRNILLPLDYAFQREGLIFSTKVNPQKLVEALVPDLKIKSQEAAQKFDETIKEKVADDTTNK